MHFDGQTWPYEMRQNKTNFGFSFGYFWRFIHEGRRRKGKREEEEEEVNKGLDTCLDFLWFCLNLLWKCLCGY